MKYVRHPLNNLWNIFKWSLWHVSLLGMIFVILNSIKINNIVCRQQQSVLKRKRTKSIAVSSLLSIFYQINKSKLWSNLLIWTVQNILFFIFSQICPCICRIYRTYRGLNILPTLLIKLNFANEGPHCYCCSVPGVSGCASKYFVKFCNIFCNISPCTYGHYCT